MGPSYLILVLCKYSGDTCDTMYRAYPTFIRMLHVHRFLQLRTGCLSRDKQQRPLATRPVHRSARIWFSYFVLFVYWFIWRSQKSLSCFWCETCQCVSNYRINQDESLLTDLFYGNLCYTVKYLTMSWLHSEKTDSFSNSNPSLRGRHRSRERTL